MMMMSKLVSAMEGGPRRRARSKRHRPRAVSPRPVIQPNSCDLRKGYGTCRRRSSHVAARTQVLVEKGIVAVDVGLVLGRELLALACRFDLGLRALAVERIELLPNRPAGLAGGQRHCTRIAAEAVTVGAAGQRSDRSPYGQVFSCHRHRADHECLLVSSRCRPNAYEP